jgi:hypothetical protein
MVHAALREVEQEDARSYESIGGKNKAQVKTTQLCLSFRTALREKSGIHGRAPTGALHALRARVRSTPMMLPEMHMRRSTTVATLSITVLLGACGRTQQAADLPDDLKSDLAAASAGGALTIAPQSRPPMRFVSDVEQWKGRSSVKLPKAAPHAARHEARPVAKESMDMGTAPVVAVASQSTIPEPIAAAPAPEPTTAIVPSSLPSSEPVGSGSDGVGDRGHGGGLGGLLGGIIGTVVLRGGHGGIDKCDTRTDGRGRQPVIGGSEADGRGRPPVTDRPDFGLPVPTGRVFGGGRRG